MSFGKPYVVYTPLTFPSPDVDDFSIIAPFFFDIDIRESGSITYEIHIEGQVLDFVSAFVTKEKRVPFKANWMLLTYWDAVPAYSTPNYQVC